MFNPLDLLREHTPTPASRRSGPAREDQPADDQAPRVGTTTRES